MSTPDVTTLSPKTLTALSDLLRNHRAGFKDDMDRLISKMGGSTAGGFAGSRAGAGGGSLKEQHDELTLLIKNLRRSNKTLSAYDKYMLESARKQQKAIQARIKAEEDSTDATDENTDETKRNSDALGDNTRAQSAAKDSIKDFAKGIATGTVAVKGFQHLVDEMRTSYKLGMKWDPVSDALNGIKMGMDPKEMMEFQAQFRRTSGALAGGMQQFNNTVADNQTQMVQYTGSMKAAAQAMGNMFEISHSMGLNFSDVGSSANDLFSQFKRMNAATSLTIDQFADLTKSLIDDSDIRSKLLTLQTQQRSVYVQSLLKQHDILQAQGMTFEAAQKFVKFVENTSNKDPLERMKQGAQMMNVSRMLGFDPKRAQRLMTLNNKRDKDTKENSEYSALLKDFTERAHAKMGTGTDVNGIKQGEIIMRKILSATGIDLQPMDDLALQSSAKRDPASVALQTKELQERSNDWLQLIYKQSTIVADVLGSWSNAAIGLAVGGIALALINKRGGAVDSLLDRVMGRSGAGGGGGPGPGGPGPGPAGGRWRARAATAFGRVGAGAAIMGAGAVGSSFLDPSKFSEENKQSAGVAQSALQWGTAGAGLGAMGGPLGAAIGGGLGVMLGVAKSLYEYSNDYQGQATKIMNMNTAMQSADSARIIAQREAAKQQLEALNAQGDLSIEQKRTVDELTKKVQGLNEQLSVEQKKTQMSMIGALGPAGQALLKGDVDSAGELRERATSLDVLAGQAGLSGTNSLQNWVNSAYAQASNQGASNDELAKLSKFAGAVQSGGDMDMPRELKKYFDPAGGDALASLQRMGGSQYQSILGGMDSQGLSSFVNDSISKVTEMDQKIADLEQQRDNAIKSPSIWDETGLTGLNEAFQIDKQIAEAKAMKENQIKMAQGLEDALNGNRSLQTSFDKDSLEALAAIIKGKKPAEKSNAANTGN